MFDLGEKAPDKVLHQLYVTLGTLKYNGDTLATEIEKRLRIIVSGLFKLWLMLFPSQISLHTRMPKRAHILMAYTFSLCLQ